MIYIFKFQRIMSCGVNWQDNLFFEDEFTGNIGRDKDGLYLYLKRELTLKEMNLLISQIALGDPNLLNDTIEIKVEE